jgi:hypothetical protein
MYVYSEPELLKERLKIYMESFHTDYMQTLPANKFINMFASHWGQVVNIDLN